MKVLVTARSFGKITNEPFEILAKEGIDIVTHPRRGPLEKDEIIPLIKDVDACIVGTDIIDAGVLDAGKMLKVVAKHGVGLDNIDLEAAKKRKIAVTNTPGTNVNAVAEMAVCFMLGLSRNLVTADEFVRAGKWGTLAGQELTAKTVGIVGLGAIGRRVCQLLAGFQVQTLAYDPFADKEWANDHGIKLVSLDELLTAVDYVSIHVPLTKQTKNLIGQEQLAKMKRSAFLINLARGGVVNEEELARALKEGTIAGAGIDVFSEEPPSLSNPLFQAPNVILTPHTGAHSVEAMNAMSVDSAKNVIDILTGKPCPNIITN